MVGGGGTKKEIHESLVSGHLANEHLKSLKHEVNKN